eukprot:3243438-Rhodomonas_salina.1
MTADRGSLFCDLFVFDPKRLRWSDLSQTTATMLTARNSMGVTAFAGALYVFGGAPLDGQAGLIGDLSVYRHHRVVQLATFSLFPVLMRFLFDHDDVALAPNGSYALETRSELCTGSLPCQLTIRGETAAAAPSVVLHPGAQLSCNNANGCVLLSL